MNRKKVVFLFLFIFSIPFLSNTQNNFSTKELRDNLNTLASDEFEGREAGTQGGKAAAEYIREKFKDIGLTLLAEEGFQDFPFQDGRKMGDQSYLSIGEYVANPEVEYASYVYTPGVNARTKVVFVGYGIDSQLRNDYKNIDVKGKWVLMFNGKPESEQFKEIKIAQNKKIDNARKKGAKGVLLVDPPILSVQDTIYPERLTAIFYNMPTVQIKRSLADIMFRDVDLSVDSAVELYSRTDTLLSQELNVVLNYKSDIVPSFSQGINVIGLLEGNDPKLKNEVIVIGAHFDHLGTKYKDSDKSIYYGADDNASGVVGVIALAKNIWQNIERPKRTIVFIAFDAEEKGLLGSAYFINNLPEEIKKTKIVAMINLDMIGRYHEEEGLNIVGYNSSKEGDALIKSLEKKSNLYISCNNRMFRGSDHVNFYAKSIPVFFFFTGLHDDYHKPTDTPDKINYEKMVEVLSFTDKLIMDLADRNKSLKFKEIR